MKREISNKNTVLILLIAFTVIFFSLSNLHRIQVRTVVPKQDTAAQAKSDTFLNYNAPGVSIQGKWTPIPITTQDTPDVDIKGRGAVQLSKVRYQPSTFDRKFVNKNDAQLAEINKLLKEFQDLPEQKRFDKYDKIFNRYGDSVDKYNDLYWCLVDSPGKKELSKFYGDLSDRYTDSTEKYIHLIDGTPKNTHPKNCDCQ